MLGFVACAVFRIYVALVLVAPVSILACEVVYETAFTAFRHQPFPSFRLFFSSSRSIMAHVTHTYLPGIFRLRNISAPSATVMPQRGQTAFFLIVITLASDKAHQNNGAEKIQLLLMNQKYEFIFNSCNVFRRNCWKPIPKRNMR